MIILAYFLLTFMIVTWSSVCLIVAYDVARGYKKRKKIKIKYFDESIDKLVKIDKGDWIDLRSAEEVKLKAGEYHAVKLGVAMELPKGYEAMIAPRSSTFKRYHIICPNSIGIIDNSYCGDNDQWHFIVYALKDTTIPKNERICQFRITESMKTPKIKFVKKLQNKDRGGIGSTNKL